MAATQKLGKSHKLARSKRHAHKSERQWYRTARNKFKRIQYQRALAGLPPLKFHVFKGKNDTSIHVSA